MEEEAEKREEREEKLINQRKEKLNNWLKDYHNLLLAGLIIFVIILYLFYFFKVGNQPIWWDEGDYLAIGKELAFNRARPEWWESFTRTRPLGFSLASAAIFKLGLGETSVRFFLELLPALASIFLIYYIGKELFNKKIGLIAAFLMAVNWTTLFYTFRLLTDLPSLFLSSLALFFFWVKYEKPILNNQKEKPIFLFLAVAFGISSFMVRYVSGIVLFIIAVYLLTTRKFSLFKNKNMWIAVIIGLLVLSPFLYYNYSTKGTIFPAYEIYHGEEATARTNLFRWNILTLHLPNFFKSFLLIFFIIGFFLLLEIFFYFDLIIRQKEKSKNNLLYCLMAILIPFIYFVFIIRAGDARYFIATLPLLYVVCALGIDFTAEKISKMSKSKILYLAVIFIIIFIGAFQQLKASDEFIMSRVTSFKEVKDAGLWLKENTPEDAKIITASILQNQYYSERHSYDFHVNGAQNETLFDEKVRTIKPNYLIVSVYESAYTPQWAFAYPQKYNLTIVQAYSQNNQPMLIIYKFPENFNY